MEMKERLEVLKKRHSITWQQLAVCLDISKQMIGCLRRGDRNASKKLLKRIEAFEASEPGVSMLSYSQLHENFNKMQEIAMGQMEALSRLRANYEKVMELLRQQTQANAELLTLLSEVDSGSAQ